MKGDINMSLWAIRGNPDPIFDDQLIRKKYTDDKFVTITGFRKQLSETLLWEYFKKYSSSVYRFDRGSNNSELVYNTTTRKVSKLLDQSLEENDAVQNTTNLQPLLCTKSEKVGNRYFLKFNGTQRMISDINSIMSSVHVTKKSNEMRMHIAGQC